MENVGNKESGNRDGRDSATIANITGISNDNGSSIRPNDGNKPPIDVGNSTSKSGTVSNIGNDARGIGGDSRVEITDGYYFTPNGTITRIPVGHYIGSDGRLRKRRQSKRNSSNSDGNAHRDRPETGEYEKEFSTEDTFRIDKPLNIRGGRRKAKTVKAETSKMTMITLLSSGAAAIFTSIQLLTKHEHWKLQSEEAIILAEALNDAISTLPEKYYAQVVGIIEKWIPWVNLCFVVGAIIIPRIEASAKRIEKTYPKPSEPSNARDVGTKDNPFSNWSSLGYNQ